MFSKLQLIQNVTKQKYESSLYGSKEEENMFKQYQKVADVDKEASLIVDWQIEKKGNLIVFLRIVKRHVDGNENCTWLLLMKRTMK